MTGTASPERREHPRLSLEWPVDIRRTGEEGTVRCTTSNVSCGGLCFLARETFRPGERLELALLLPEDADPKGRPVRLRCLVTVLRTGPVEAAPGYSVACRIHDYDVHVDAKRLAADRLGRSAVPAGAG